MYLSGDGIGKKGLMISIELNDGVLWAEIYANQIKGIARTIKHGLIGYSQ